VTLEILSIVGLVLAAIPALMIVVNLALYRTPSLPEGGDPPRVSILVPARDEEAKIARSVEAALSSRGVDLEVVVMDDHSTDRTVEIVQAIAAKDPRVRVEHAPDLPSGWSGKPHACHALAAAAKTPRLLFIDADVELMPDPPRVAHDMIGALLESVAADFDAVGETIILIETDFIYSHGRTKGHFLFIPDPESKSAILRSFRVDPN